MVRLREEPKKRTIVLVTAAVVFAAVVLFAALRSGAGAQGGHRWADGVYTSEFLRLRFVLPEGWEVWDEKALGSASAGDAVGAERARIQNSYLMWAGSVDREAIVYIQAARVSNPPDTQGAGDEVLSFYNEMVEGVVAERLPDREAAGKTWYSLHLTADDTQQYLFIRMQEDYVVSISLGGALETELLWILDQFEAWEPA